MKIEKLISNGVTEAVKNLYDSNLSKNSIQIQKTRKEFKGDITLIVFPLLKISKKNPELTGNDLGNFLKQNTSLVIDFNVIKGFLNLEISDNYYILQLNDSLLNNNYGFQPADQDRKTYMIEYSSPNTNKPLHLGHIRNNLLGFSISEIIKANGNEVLKTNLVNDRGIHICKSMLAWKKWGNGETPLTSGKKGDHLVGDYYVKFDMEYKNQIKDIIDKGLSEEEAAKNAPLIKEAQEMLRKWEAKDPETVSLWKEMNGWVYKGFNETYEKLGVNFDKVYYESDTYLIGKETVLKGLKDGIFYKKEDNSIWIDLSGDGLDEKILLRSDGTSVYITQDIGTAQLRQKDINPDKMVYVVGNEQNYHFKVLSLVLDKLGFIWAKDLYHLSYGMVELPEGKMKSREGTVVDADDLIDEMIITAREMSKELGKLEELTTKEKEETYRIIGLGALKYFILKVDPSKNMTFNPKESIDFNGHTGPFIQYTYARIKSIFRKAAEDKISLPKIANDSITINKKEKTLLKLIYDFPKLITESAENYNPALLANYIYEISKEFNQFYHDNPILKIDDKNTREFRLCLSQMIAKIIKKSMNLLGIEVPERM